MLFNFRKSSAAVAEAPEAGENIQHLNKSRRQYDEYRTILDSVPFNVIMCDPETVKITFANKQTIKTLNSLAGVLPDGVDPENIVGTCIDIFHKDAAHPRSIISDRSKLPYTARIQLGDQRLAMKIEAIEDRDGNYASTLLTWNVVTHIDAFAERIGSAISEVAAKADDVKKNALSVSDAAKSASLEVTNAASGADQATENTKSVATASEEMHSSISELERQVGRSKEISAAAVGLATEANDTVSSLAEASERIGEVIGLIQEIAEQTNLLALNATIEAARAGEAGKGFAVVAAEVKELSAQTARATEEISGQINAIQNATGSAVDAIGNIGSTIDEINDVTNGIATAITEQGSATAEISRSISEAATGIQGVSNSIGKVSDSAIATETSSAAILDASEQLATFSARTTEDVEKFLEEIKDK